LRGHELATSPYSFPAFGLLATLSCSISFHRLYWIEPARKQQSSLCSPILARRTSFGEQHDLCVNLHSIQLLSRRRGMLSDHRLLPDDRPAIPPVLVAAAFAQHISYGSVLYENLSLLFRLPKPKSYRCLSALQSCGRSDGCLCAGTFRCVSLTGLRGSPRRYNLCYNNTFLNPLALTFWGGAWRRLRRSASADG
jgi:hypothetical protein